MASVDLAFDTVEEADELLMAVALHVLADDRSVENVERGEQRRRAVPLVVMPGAALLHGQAGLGAVERLDLRLLVDRQHHRMSRRIDIQANDIGEFLGECRVVRQLEAPPAVRAETVGLPDRLHRRGGDTGRRGHRAQRPGGGSPLRAVTTGIVSWRQLRRREAGWGGSPRRNPERTNRNRIEGRCDGVSQLWVARPDSRSDIALVNPAATGGKIRVLPREISAPLGRTE